MDLKQRIDELVEARVLALLDSLVGDTTGRSVGATLAAVSGRKAVASIDEPIVRRRRRKPTAPRTAYVINYKGSRAPELIPSHASVWNALVKAKGPLSAKDLETASSEGKKTVESSVWWLRNHDINGARVKPGSRAALISSVAAE